MRKLIAFVSLFISLTMSAIADYVTCGVGTEQLVLNGYVPLEYITLENGQFIDTKLIPSNHQTEMQVYEASYTNDKHYFGTSANATYYHFTTYNRSYYWGLAGSERHAGTWSVGKHTLIYNSISRGDVILDGMALGNATGTTSNSSLYIGRRQSGSANFSGDIYYVKITDRGDLSVVRDFIPVRRITDGAVGMFDRVEGKFYGNSGTGDFIAGPDVANTCLVCATGYYNDTGNNTSCVACPTGYNATGDNASDHDDISDCKITCSGGFYLAAQYGTNCVQTGVGYWSPYHKYGYGDTGVRNQCPDGLTTIGFGPGADEVGDCGYLLHIGNDVVYLRSERKTIPSLNLAYGNRIFYGSMDTYITPMNVDTTNKLHIKYNDIVYSVHDDSITPDSTGYIFTSDGRLVGARDNIYLESNGTQYIDTGVTTDKIVCDLDYAFTELKNESALFGNWQVGNIYHITLYNNRAYFGPGSASEISLSINGFYTLDRNIISLSDNGKLSFNGNIVYDTPVYNSVVNGSIILFGRRAHNNGTQQHTLSKMRVFSFHMTRDTNAVRDFIPVPKGMIINGYTVPENGMWDTVEQKFYGNAGDGEFIYGVGE